MTTFLITGGCGFLGTWLAKALVAERGNEVVLVDVSAKGRLLRQVSGMVRIEEADVTSTAKVTEVLRRYRPEVLVHYAAILSGAAESDPNRGYRIDIESTWPLFEAARAADVGCVLFASSIAAYGPGTRTAREDFYSAPATVYGISKVFGEMAGMWFQRRYGIQFAALRYASVIGPGRTNGGASAYTSLAIQKAAQGEPYTISVPHSAQIPIVYVKDMVDATLHVYRNVRSLEHRILNVASLRRSPTALELAHCVAKQVPEARTNFQPSEEIGATIASWPRNMSTSRLESTGWVPRFRELETLVADFVEEVRLNLPLYQV